MSNELKRKAVHVSMIAWALLIGRIAPWQVNAICLSALLFNIFLLRRVTSGTLERTQEREQGYSIGLLAYPAVLLLIGLVWHEQQIIMAIAWGAMAFGDGFASVIGQRISSPKLSWNPSKTWAGFLGFISVAFPLTSLFIVGLLPEAIREGASLQAWTGIIFIAVIVGAIAESQEGFVDDNIAVPLAAAWVASIAFSAPKTFPSLPADWLLGMAAVTVFAVGSVALKKIDRWGGFAGWLCSFGIYLGGGWTCLGLLFVFFAGGSFASSWGIERKRAFGAAQENNGMRSVVHALSNGGVAAACGVCAWLFPAEVLMWKVMLAASLAAATSDTFSSEFGTLYGKRFRNILTFKPDVRGQDGVISLEGIAWGLAGSAMVAIVFALGLGLSWAVGIILVAGVLANLMDSLLGASLQRLGLMNNHSVNFTTTLIAALLVRIAWEMIA